MRLAASVVFLAMLATLGGCGKGKGPAPVPAKGVAKLNGVPAEGLLLQFHPTEKTDRPVAGFSAVSGSDGRFEVIGADKTPGAIPGKYKVTVIDNNIQDDDADLGKNKPRTVNRIPSNSRYIAPNTTPIEVTIEAGKSEYDIDVRVP